MAKDTGTSAGYCRSCDYDLRGLPDKHRCPECGQEFDRADPRSVRHAPRRHIWTKLRWVVYPILVVVLAAGAGVGWTYWEWKREQPVIAWAKAHSGWSFIGTRTKPIGPGWLQTRAGRWAYLLERADGLGASSDEPVKAADLPVSRLRYLTGLRLDDRGMGDDLMGEVGRLRELKELRLVMSTVTDTGLARLRDCRKIDKLDLFGSRVGDKGLAPLADHPELTYIDISGIPIDDSTLPVLKGLTKLTYLDLTSTKITPAGIAELRKALPGCQIYGP